MRRLRPFWPPLLPLIQQSACRLRSMVAVGLTWIKPLVPACSPERMSSFVGFPTSAGFNRTPMTDKMEAA